jgi:hypothetical protein
MAQVPNPFKLYDDYLLDCVFNPLTWWMEYKFGKNAMDIRFGASGVGFIGFSICSMIIGNPTLFLANAIMFSSVQINSAGIRNYWHSNNKTGKNALRINGFDFRRLIDFFTVAFVITAAFFPFYLALALSISWFLMAFVPNYLDATDATPPKFREFKTVPQI